MADNANDKPTEEFKRVIKDFVTDIKKTFPEYCPLINKWWKDAEHFAHIEDPVSAIAAAEQVSTQYLFNFCQKKYPPRFFDILYKNDDMFKEDSTMDTEFLPNIYFKNIWGFDISSNTRDIIWKYLQLILFSIVGSMDNKDMFGDTAKLFEGIDENDFKSKLEETLEQMKGLFENMKPDGGEGASDGGSSGLGDAIPNAQDIHDHITGMLDGKLGKLAKEIAEETAADLNLDMDNDTDMQGVFNNLMKNPTKLMGLVKKVGSKLDGKIKSGDLKESELIAEATDIMNKMKNMPGMDNIQAMLGKMGMGGMGGIGGIGGMGGGGKVNMGAMNAQMERNMKAAKTKERIQAKAAMNRLAREQAQAQAQAQNAPVDLAKQIIDDEKLAAIFSSSEKAERTPRGAQTQKKGKKAKK